MPYSNGYAHFWVGIVTAIVKFFIVWLADHLSSWYVSLLSPDGIHVTAKVYGRYLGFSLLFSLLALLPVALLRPVAAGSGVAEAKAVLNGIKIPYCTQLSSAACKAISLIFAVPSSLPVGVEGPLIFIGMAIGENAARVLPMHFSELRSWRAMRDFAAVGTAAGVTAAFLAPIGGILFVAEEGASFINSKLMSRCFYAAVTVVVSDYLISTLDNGGAASLRESQPFAVSLARFNGLPSQKEDMTQRSYPLFGFYDYFVIALVGVFGGVIGGLFVEASKYLSKVRIRYISNVERKLMEVVFLSVLATTTLAWIPTVEWMSECKPLDMRDGKYFVQLNCKDDQYNDLATLLRQPLPIGINLLYWEDPSAFSAKSCIISGFIVLILLTLTFGASISMGIFIPLLFVGAAWGRSFALTSPEMSDVRTYAIVGSAAALNGVIRVLVSLTVIIMETTNQATFASPLMIVCLTSRWIGNRLFGSQGIYDEILKLRQIPFLDASPPQSTQFTVLRAKDIMSKDFARMQSRMRVGDILSTLEKLHQLDFVITDTDEKVLGSISRESLVAILWNKNSWIQTVDEGTDESSKNDQSELRYADFQFDRLDEVSYDEITQHFKQDSNGCESSYIDLLPFMSISPITFGENGSAQRAYELFRTNGLRQLIIINEEGKCVGVVTRSSLKALEEGDLIGVSTESVIEQTNRIMIQNNIPHTLS